MLQAASSGFQVLAAAWKTALLPPRPDLPKKNGDFTNKPVFESEITHRQGLGIIHVTPEYMLTPGPKAVLLRSMPVHGDSFVIFSWGDPKLK